MPNHPIKTVQRQLSNLPHSTVKPSNSDVALPTVAFAYVHLSTPELNRLIANCREGLRPSVNFRTDRSKLIVSLRDTVLFADFWLLLVMSSKETHQQLDDIRQTILKFRNVPDTVFDELHTKISNLLALVEIQKKLNELARAVREANTLPVRRINYNIRKLAEDDEACKPRWTLMQKLNCPAILFSTMAFNGLFSLPDKQYESLVENVQEYIQVQELPSEWIARDQIKRVDPIISKE
ncbi:hypothetical protein VC83_01204 [Pseudogymnoascus destructans]|nr:uncharacterized protein VC83_01204 [Pseudogymnoascus destructans]OAF62633.1 hypothetical protein VC83_01204 [Pseudogymnoascus destructans]